MRNSLLELVLKHSYRGDLDIGFSDSILTEIVAEKVHIPGIAGIDIIAMDKYLKVRTYAGVSRILSIKANIKLEYDSFKIREKTALLSFNLLCPKIIRLTIRLGIKNFEFISIKDNRLVLDFYKLDIIQKNELLKNYCMSIRDLKFNFSPQTISVKAKLLHDEIAV
nr:hypothetical protein [Candidatus Cloacimonadota bacterium]